MLLQTRRDRNICNYLRYTALPLKKSRKNKSLNLASTPPIGFSSLPGIRSEQKQYFGHIAIHTSDLSHCSLPAARDGSGGGLQGHCVGYPACQSNVRAVRCVSLLQISSPTGGKDLPVIKNSHRGRTPPPFFFSFLPRLSVFPQLSNCLHVCCHVWMSPQA